MDVKTFRLKRGIPSARMVESHGQDPVGASRVTMSISAVDSFGMAEVVTRISLSPTEAREHAVRLLHEADLADAIGDQQVTRGSAASVRQSGAERWDP